jgi:hypothetical protein
LPAQVAAWARSAPTIAATATSAVRQSTAAPRFSFPDLPLRASMLRPAILWFKRPNVLNTSCLTERSSFDRYRL